MGFALQLKALGVVNDSIQDGICQRGVWDAQVPISNRDLGSDQGGRVTETIVEDFKKILCILKGEGIAHPVIEDEQAGPGQRTQEVSERSILMGEGKGMQQAGGA